MGGNISQTLIMNELSHYFNSDVINNIMSRVEARAGGSNTIKIIGYKHVSHIKINQIARLYNLILSQEILNNTFQSTDKAKADREVYAQHDQKAGAVGLNWASTTILNIVKDFINETQITNIRNETLASIDWINAITFVAPPGAEDATLEWIDANQVNETYNTVFASKIQEFASTISTDLSDKVRAAIKAHQESGIDINAIMRYVVIGAVIVGIVMVTNNQRGRKD